MNFFVDAPTGDEDVLAGDAGGGVAIGWSNATWAFNAGYRWSVTWTSTTARHRSLRTWLTSASATTPSVSDNLDWITELVGTVPTDSDDAIFQESVDLTTGGRLWFGDTREWAFNFGLRTDLLQLGDTDEYCPIGGLLGLTYFPRFQPPLRRRLRPRRRHLRRHHRLRRAAATAATPAAGAPTPPPEERVTVQFDANSARLTNIAKAKLDEVALKMKEDPDARALVIGYTDSRGSDSANQRMSERRAQAVKDYLVQRHGIDPNRIRTEGRGPPTRWPPTTPPTDGLRTVARSWSSRSSDRYSPSEPGSPEPVATKPRWGRPTGVFLCLE